MQIIPSLAAMTAVHRVPATLRQELYEAAQKLPEVYQAVVRQILLRRYPNVRCLALVSPWALLQHALRHRAYICDADCAVQSSAYRRFATRLFEGFG